MITTRKKIEDLDMFNPITPTFFTSLVSAVAVLQDWNGEILGIDYVGRSGEKYITKLVDTLIKKDPTHAESILVNIIKARYEENWNKLFEAMTAEYNPVENYNMHEKKITDIQETTFGKTINDDDTITFGKTVDDSDTITFGKTVDDDSETTYGKKVDTEDNHSTTRTGDETTSHDVTKDDTKITPGITTTVTGDVYGYNSSTEVPSDKKIERRTGEDEQTHLLEEETNVNYNNVKDDYSGIASEELSGSDKIERDYAEGGTEGHVKDYSEGGTEKHEKDYEEGGTEKVEHTYEFERTGNIGVTTSQQMIESSIELARYAFLELVYADCDKVLTLQTY